MNLSKPGESTFDRQYYSSAASFFSYAHPLEMPARLGCGMSSSILNLNFVLFFSAIWRETVLLLTNPQKWGE